MSLTTDAEEARNSGIDPATGMQQKYVILSDEERAKGFVRPVRRSYTHLQCGGSTRMGLALCETYARDPAFYGGTYCASCRGHFPLRGGAPGATATQVTADGYAFTWDEDGAGVGS